MPRRWWRRWWAARWPKKILDALGGAVHAPYLLDVEVLSALRGPSLSRKLAPDVAEQARRDYFDFTIERHEIAPMADRIWKLRYRYTSDDATSLALTEAFDAPLHTCDAKLNAGGHGATVRVIKQSR